MSLNAYRKVATCRCRCEFCDWLIEPGEKLFATLGRSYIACSTDCMRRLLLEVARQSRARYAAERLMREVQAAPSWQPLARGAA